MPSGKTILVAGAALLVLGGAGAGAWIASSDDEGNSAPFEQALTGDTGDESESTSPDPVVQTEQEPAAPQPEPEPEPEQQPQEPGAAAKQDKPTRTRFPSERKEPQRPRPRGSSASAREFPQRNQPGTVRQSAAIVQGRPRAVRAALRARGFPIGRRRIRQDGRTGPTGARGACRPRRLDDHIHAE